MTGLRLLPLGVGDAFSAKHYSTCLALCAEDRWLLIDCPHPIRKMMREASARSGIVLDADQLETVAIAHLHADHASGLEGLGFFSHFVLGRRVRVAAHPDVAQAVSKTWVDSGGLALSGVEGAGARNHRAAGLFRRKACPVGKL